MGNFYVNHTVRTEDRVKLHAVLRHNKLAAYISPAKNGCVSWPSSRLTHSSPPL